MASKATQQIWREAEGRLCTDTKGGYASRASQKNRQGHWRRVAKEVYKRQEKLPGCPQIHAARSNEIARKYAYAVGIRSRG